MRAVPKPERSKAGSWDSPSARGMKEEIVATLPLLVLTRALSMKYESFDRFEVAHLLGELCAVVLKHHKHGSTTQEGKFERPNDQIVSMD